MDEAAAIAEDTLKCMLSTICAGKSSTATIAKESAEDRNTLSETLSTDNTIPSSFLYSKSTIKPKKSQSLILKRVLNFEDPTLIVNIGSFAFKANMEVLEMYSEYMKTMEDCNEISFPADKVSPMAFVAIYEWMLCDNPQLPRKGIIELYKGASYLGVTQLIEQFWECISDPLIKEDRAFLLYLEALAFDVPEIRITMLTRISHFFLAIVSSEEFLHFPLDDIVTLVRSSLIAVNSEMEVFYACVRYFDFNWDERRPHLYDVMKYIRYDFLPTNFLLELLSNESESAKKDLSRMVDHTELQSKLRDLLDYYCLAAFPGPNSVSIEKSSNRKWVYDVNCSYHVRETPSFANPTNVLYVEFLEYLCSLYITSIAKHWEYFEVLNIESEPEDKMPKIEIIE